MGLFFGIVGFLALLVIWSFLTFTPKWVNKRAVWAYNWAMMGLAFAVCIPYILKTRSSMMEDPESYAFWPVVATFGAFGIMCVILFLAFVMRNFFIFRPTRMKGRW